MSYIRSSILGITFVIAVGIFSGRPRCARGAEAAPADARPLTATILQVQGIVQVREGDDKPWGAAKSGMVIGEGAEFRTGPKSAVMLKLEPEQIITLDRLGTVKLLEAVRDGRKIKTDLGMKYGRVRYDIEAAGEEHDATIHTPGSTLAVRGTDVIFQDEAPWVPNAISVEGRVEFRNFRRQVVAFGGTRTAKIRATESGAAETARKETRADPKGAFAGRSDSEEERIENLASTTILDDAAIRSIQQLARISGFEGDFIGVLPVPGPVVFELIWQSAGKPGPTNLDLLVTDPNRQTASKSNPTIGSGSATGRFSGDQLGSKGAGVERVEWGKFFPPGIYQFQVKHAGGGPAQAFILVSKQDKTIRNFGTDLKNPLILHKGETFSGTVTIKNGSSATRRR